MKKNILFSFFSFINLLILSQHVYANVLPVAAACGFGHIDIKESGIRTFRVNSKNPIGVEVRFNGSCTTDVDSPNGGDGVDVVTGEPIKPEGMTFKWVFPPDVDIEVISGNGVMPVNGIATIVEGHDIKVKFTKVGIHRVSLWVRDRDGGYDTANMIIGINTIPVIEPPGDNPLIYNLSPIAEAGGPYVAAVREKIQFDGFAVDHDETFGNGKQYLRYGWNYGDGCKFKEQIKAIYDLFGDPISYREGPAIFYDGDGSVSVDIVDDGSNTGKMRREYVVEPGEYCLSTGENPVHVFSKPGLHTVSLKVVDKFYPWGKWITNPDNLGGINDKIFIAPGTTIVGTTVLVNQPPHAAISSPQQGIVNQAIEFNAGFSYDNDGEDISLTALWDFGDGYSGVGERLTHTYDEPGIYHVSLVVTDKYHASEAISHSVKITTTLPNQRLKQLTDNTSPKSNVQIHDGHAIWKNGYGRSWFDVPISLFDTDTGITTTVVSNNTFDMRQKIHSGQIVWSASDGNDNEIFLFDSATGKTTQLTSNDKNDINPEVDSGQVVWLSPHEWEYKVFLFDSATGMTTQLSDGLAGSPHIHNGQIVWSERDGNDNEIFLYDIATEAATQLTDNDKNDGGPRIHNGKVVWWAGGGIRMDEQYPEVFLYDIATKATTQLTDNSHYDGFPQIHNGQVVWSARNEYDDTEIFLYDIDTNMTTQLTDNDQGGLHPKIYNGQVIWRGWDGKDFQVFLYNIPN
jgi:PKD repeat protein